ncbi:MAG: hydrogenase maturation protease [Bryobacteraceae bacterium]|jgi:hydrogenase maturation protease
MPHTLILAYGNPLRGDDGIGPEAGERLRSIIRDPDVEIRTMHQLTPELMEPISRAARVIFIDACKGGVPGEIRERAIEPSTSPTRFTHHATPEGLLAGARALYGRAAEATILTVAGAEFSLSSGLSPAAASSLDGVVAATLRWLAR